MEALLLKVPDYVQLIALIGMVISLAATVIVRITPSKLDDDAVGRWAGKFVKILAWLPTIGVNPRTKALEQAYQELAKKDEPPKAT